MEKGQINTYASYDEYLARQREKSSDANRRKKWLGIEWLPKLEGFEKIFKEHAKIISSCKNALTLGARTGQEVVALKSMGIEAIGIDLVPHEPLVIKGDFHNIPFSDKKFDFVFSNCYDHSLYPHKFIEEIERVLKPGGHCLLQLQMKMETDEYTETKVDSVLDIASLFKNSKLILAKQLKKNFANMNYEILFQKQRTADFPKDITVSIVIATFNRKEVLKKLLDSLDYQTDKNFEVIVAVDGSSDGTQEMLENYKRSANFQLNWVDTNLKNEYGLATARNMGIKAASGDAVVIIDDDSFPVPEFVTEHKKSVKQNTLTGGARLSTEPNDIELKNKMMVYLEVYGDCKPQKFKPIPIYKWVVENNTCMYKEDWLRSGLFDESIKTYGSIGQTFNKSLIKKGFLYQFNPRAVITHHVEYKQNQIYKKNKFERKSVIRTIIRNRVPALYSLLKKLKHWIEYR